MRKQKKKYPSHLPDYYRRETCPICKSKAFDYIYYTEWGIGTVEQHGYCARCGYFVEQAYSDVVHGISDIIHGHKDINGKYHAKNVRRHKRIRRKAKINGNVIPLNQPWMRFV